MRLLKETRRPSPALLIALLALLVASGVPAEAARLITGNDIRNNSIPGSKLKDRSVIGTKIRKSTLTGAVVRDHSLTPRDFKGSVRGPAGPAGPAGTAKAYADVGQGGVVNPFASKNIGRVEHPSAGVYCFYLSFKPSNIQVTPDIYRSGKVIVTKATTRPDDKFGNPCPGSESASVRTLKLVKGTLTRTDGEIWVEFN